MAEAVAIVTCSMPPCCAPGLSIWPNPTFSFKTAGCDAADAAAVGYFELCSSSTLQAEPEPAPGSAQWASSDHQIL